MAYVIGVDSGGTKTEGIAYDLSGNEIERVVKGFGNLLVDYETGLTNIKTTITELLACCGPECQLIVLGLAGIDSSGLKATLEQELASLNRPLLIINDGKLAHLSVLKGQDGVLLISGTGSVVIGRKANTWERVGGWGHLLGDEGSAYDIAKKAVQVGLNEYDQNLPLSELTSQVMTHFQVPDIMGVVKVFYQLNKGQVAELAAIVAEMAETNSQAQAILKAAGKNLATQVMQLKEKIALNDSGLKIGFNGSVIEKNKLVQEAFLTELTANSIEAEIIQEAESSAKGAYYLYEKGWESK